jgi:hypothetical protein
MSLIRTCNDDYVPDELIDLFKSYVGEWDLEPKPRKPQKEAYYTYGVNHIALEELNPNEYTVSWKFRNEIPKYEVFDDLVKANDYLDMLLKDMKKH